MFGFGLNSKKWVKVSQKTEKETKKKAGAAFHTWKNIKNAFSKDLEVFDGLCLENQAKISLTTPRIYLRLTLVILNSLIRNRKGAKIHG